MNIKWIRTAICGVSLGILLIICVNQLGFLVQAESLEIVKEQTRAVAGVATAIPSLNITGDISGMQDKSDVRKFSVQYHDGDKEFSAYATLKVQGDASLRFEKKNYTIKFYKDRECTEKRYVDLGWGKQNKYCLKANWVDQTHARNIVSARLAAEMQAKYGILQQAPNHGLIDGYPIEIYNNKEFLGLYTLNIPKDAWMFGMDEKNKDHLVFYGENWEPATTFRGHPDFNSWSLEVGEETDENLQKLDRMFTFVMESSDEEFKEHFAEYLDLDATLNYMILCELGIMADNLGKNILLVTYDGRIWYPSLYDMDSSWGTNWQGLNTINRVAIPVSYYNQLFFRVEVVFSEERAQRYFLNFEMKF